ncbi:DNA polymerase III subunit epsilon [Taklimakanibacter albus]|uniref:DNA polymerase III subunit epsilon n=1 Tax=Taklimakanibacter albus TaxID=2800327 RepID=A0ACC5QWQ3_9HYPH|nr:DNA polymerase III subunit epsilon [Aestuariivirga sp. YIM B02566]MBK1864772.1 DNA polymerase III subunit epsilon [Aestuariivirga sp. YIM B02566]
MREIVLDTETTGIDHSRGHRVVEIGAVELVNHIPSGKTFHHYIDPERDMPPDAEAIHGLSTQFLRGKPVFAAIAQEFIEFIDGASLVIHNAAFDVGFLNAELARVKGPSILPERVIDTLALARQKHPMGPNSLDALCKRYGVDNSKREKHGALLDSELLADVYLELIGGRQTALSLSAIAMTARAAAITPQGIVRARPHPLPSRLTEAEIAAHKALLAELGDKAMWNEILN